MVAATSVALASIAYAPSATAQTTEPPAPYPLRWGPAWTHANGWDYSLASVGLTTLLVETALFQSKTAPPRWVGPVLFDEPVEKAFRLSSDSGQQAAETTSWVLWFPLVGYPLVVDVPYAWKRYGSQVAWDLFWQSATALSVSAAADLALRDSIARVRPKNTACVEEGRPDCYNGPEVTRSFPSGHVSETTTAAALICTQHLTMRLYGAPWDAITCATAVTADAGVAVVKMMADDHWATDILAGAALGVAFGWGLPTIMHFHGPATADGPRDAMPLMVAPVPLAFARGGGLGVAAIF